MARSAIPRHRPHALIRRVAALALTLVALLAALPTAADAQFGRLRKLRKGRPDSAAVAADTTDSARTAPADSAKGGRSRLRRAASAARKAADRIEAVIGVSATDAALIATGVGAPGLVARKVGVDPKSVVANALGSASASRAAAAQARAGDAAALARIEAWQAVVEKHTPEIERLSLAAHTGYVATLQKLQRIQLDMMREWSRTPAPARKAAAPAGAKRRTP